MEETKKYQNELNETIDELMGDIMHIISALGKEEEKSIIKQNNMFNYR
eukprot:UN14670